MKAIGYTAPGPLDGAGALIEFDAERPSPGPRDLLVAVKAVSVNPVDSKVRSGAPAEPAPRILGFDAAGVVVATGAEVTLFKAGDEVFYAGDINRPGSNAQFQLVDERITARKPASLSFAEAAAVPLTAITAWEMLFDCFGITEGAGEDAALLIIGGAGGVGSIMIQLAKALTGLTAIATASRPETSAWARQMGADHVVDHHQPLDQEMAKLGLTPRYVAALTQTDQHFDAIIELIAPRGHVSVIDDPATLDIKPGTSESVFRDLSERVTHAAVMALPPFDLPDRFSVEIIRKEPLVLLSRQDAGKTRRERLENNPYICFDSKSWAGGGAVKFLQDEGIKIDPFYDLDALEPIGKLVQEGMGVSLVPYWSGLDPAAADLRLDVIRNERYCRRIALVTPKDTTRPQEVQALRTALLSDSLACTCGKRGDC